MIRKLIAVILVFTAVKGGEDGTSNIYVITIGSSLKQNYFNSTTSGVRIYFTPDEAFSTVQAFAELTNNADIGGCTESQFDGSAMELGAGNGSSIAGTTWSPTGGFSSGTQYYLDLYYNDLYSVLGNAFTEGQRLYVAIKFDLTNNDWACPRDDESDGDSTNDSQKGSNAYYYHIADRNAPTISGIVDGDDKSLNSSSGTTNNTSNYTKSNQVKVTIGSEDVATGGITWTKESGSGTTQTSSTALNSASANGTVTTTQNGLVNGTRYDIHYSVTDAAGNTNNYYDYNITFDTTAPTVNGVYSEESNGDMLAQGAVADFYVEFSENIDFNGAPQITLQSNVSATTAVNAATYDDGTDKAYFDWTVPDGAYSVYLDYENQTALTAASGGYIRDYAGNAATLTLPAPPSWGSQGSNASLSGTSTGGYFGVDGDDPASFTAGTVVTTGGNVIANYWNGTNTGVDITIPVANDASLKDGTIQLQSEADGTYENIGGAHTITNSNLNSNVTLSVNGSGSGNTDVTELSGYSESDVLQWRAVITDKSGNATTGTASSTTLTVDTVAPTVNNVTSTDGFYKAGESVNIVVNFSTAVSISGTPQLTLNTDNSPGSADAAVDQSGLSSGAVTFAYTVGTEHYSSDLDYESTTALSAGTYIRDVAGNDATLTLPALGTFAAAQAVVIDGVSPAAFTTGTVITVGGPVVAGYWNEDNTSVNVTVPLANDASLENGKLYIQAKIGANNYANVSSAYTIQSGDLGADKTISVAANDLEGITGFTNGATVSFTALLEDYADGSGGTGNQTTGTASSTTLIVDQQDPAAFTTGAITTLTEPVVSGYWNMHNTGLTVAVPIANDATLEDGWVQIIGKTASGAYEDVGDSVQIANGDLDGNVTVTLTAAQFEGITGLADGETITINARIDDVAQNATTGTASTTTLVVDQTAPTISYVSSDTSDANPFKIGDLVPITVKFDGNVNVVISDGIPNIRLDTDERPGTATSSGRYSSGTGSSDIIFRYTVAANEYSADLNYTIERLILNGSSIRDAAGNNASLDLPDRTDNNALKQKKDIWIDGVVPAAGTVDSVKTTGGTIMTGFWNASNTGAWVKVLLSSTDVSLEDGAVQIVATINNTGANVGDAGTITNADLTAGFKKISLTAAQIEGHAQFTDNNNVNLDVISFTAVVTDKAGNATTHSASATTLTVDETAPAAFTVGDVITVTDEVVAGYWNEDNTAINVSIPVANGDATLENGRIMIESEADGTFEYIGDGSLYNNAAYVPADHEDYYKDWTRISNSDLNTTKTLTINGAPTSGAIRELEELTNFSDGDELTFRAIIMDAAGNSTAGTVSSTSLIVDQTDPLTPTIVLKPSSDTGIANWDKLTNDATPTFTLTNVTNTDMIHLKVATDAVTLADNTLSILTQSQATSNTIDLTATTLSNGVTYLVTAVAKDLAGNWGPDATNTFVRIDLSAPDVPNAPDLLEADDTGFKNNDNITKVTQPHFIFTSLSNTRDSLRLVIDAGAVAGRDSIMSQVTTDTFKVSTALASGYHTAGVIAIDSAGNEQNTSALLAFVVDNVAPPVPTIPDMTAATDFGMSDTDNITKTQKPNFDITNLELGSFINLYHVNATPDTTLADSDTIGVGVTTTTSIPDINMADGTYTLYATAEDTAGNISESNDLSNVIIDATVPTIIANYHNKTIQTAYNGFTNKFKNDSIRVGKGGDEVDFIATMSEPAGTNPEPTLDVTYGNSATPAVNDMAKTEKANNDEIWSWKITLPTGTANNGAAKVVFTASDVAGNLAVAFTDTQKFTVDNTPPAAFTTGLASALGNTNVSMVVESKTGWFINNTTDSIKVLTPISTTDNSLVNGGYVDIQARVRNKMVNTWATINSNVATNPFFPQDSTESLGTSIPLYRKKLDIITALTGNGLLQGDTVDVRAMIYDRALNSTAGTQSESFFVLDTLPPTIGTFITDTLYTLNGKTTRLRVNQDTTWTNDTISFAIKDWVDPGSQTEKPSGIHRYEYALYQSATDANSNYSPFRDYKNQINLLDSVFIDTFALTHDRNYYVRVRAVDVAGNTSLTNGDNSKSDYVLRHNARPEVDEIIEELIAKEDVLLEQLLTVNDKDLLTLRSDKFTYSLTTIKLDTTQTPIDSSVVTNLTASVSISGKISFTPTKLDTGKYVFTTIIYDNWKNSKSPTGLNFADTSNINIRVLPVNDPPILDLSSITKLNFLEGANSDSINLTRYVYDEDDDTSAIDFSFRIASILPANIGYPTAKFGFLSDFSNDFKKSFINDLVDEFPNSTIIQKNNAFVVYPGNVTEFRDPIKLDSLRQSDSLYTWITQTDSTSADTNYYTHSDMIVEFTAKDPGGLEGKDTVTFFINPINDPPVWAGLRDTVVKENDSLYLDFANYLTDVDDSTLTLTILPLTYDANVTVVPSKTFEKKATGYEYISKARNDTVKFKPDALWFKKDAGPWDPTDTTSNQIKFKITAADGDTSAIDTFVVKVQRVPRPEIRMYVVQNNAFTNYYEIFLVDSVGKTKDLTLKVQSKAVTLDTAAAFTYVGHYSFQTKGNYSFEVAASGVVGDTSITETVGLTLAKMYGKWSGNSADGQFQVIGQNGSVDFDQSIMILDSTLFEPYFNDRASYLLGNDAYRFKKSVEISMPGDDDEMAIYRRSTGSGWIELPSITMGNRVNAYTEKMGYFRMGPKTLIVPGQTSLHQNYPNPFNPVTTIEYDLGFVDGPFQRVTVTVYDILGRNVKTLVSEEQSIGRYRVRWNGKDGNGVPVSSGVYFVHLLTDMGRSQTKKIMLMR
tara:strand:- start:11500 stop:19866 length:8367 start_codon:yes stop_codon:yes gene_type:complete